MIEVGQNALHSPERCIYPKLEQSDSRRLASVVETIKIGEEVALFLENHGLRVARPGYIWLSVHELTSLAGEFGPRKY